MRWTLGLSLPSCTDNRQTVETRAYSSVHIFFPYIRIEREVYVKTPVVIFKIPFDIIF